MKRNSNKKKIFTCGKDQHMVCFEIYKLKEKSHDIINKSEDEEIDNIELAKIEALDALLDRFKLDSSKVRLR